MAITEEQTKIASALMQGPKTPEELDKAVKLGIGKLNAELKQMLKLELIRKTEGFPVKYELMPAIAKSVHARRAIEEDDSNKIRLRCIIEGKAVELDLLKKQLQEMETLLRKEKAFRIYEARLEKAIKEGEHYSSFLEVNLSVKDFRALMKLMFFYGPISIEVIKPSKLELSADELQDGLVDSAGMIHAYTNYIMKMMTRAEVAEFHKKLFKK